MDLEPGGRGAIRVLGKMPSEGRKVGRSEGRKVSERIKVGTPGSADRLAAGTLNLMQPMQPTTPADRLRILSCCAQLHVGGFGDQH